FITLRCLILVALLAAPVLRAHSVWVEDTPEKTLVVRFGEVGEKFETSPGHLDRLPLPVAWTPGPDGKPARFTVEKKSDHFLFVSAAIAQPALGETVFPVMKRGDRPASRPHFYLRWQPQGAPIPPGPSLTLDLLPTGTTGEFRVYLRSQPLPQAVVVVQTAGKESEINADAEGRFRFTVAPPGLVLLTCNHKENVKGFAAGAAYDVTSHNAALTWRQP
ncbi:MAG: hypothetical protein ACREH8_13550, partial [Opitutaceae bacterium]